MPKGNDKTPGACPQHRLPAAENAFAAAFPGNFPVLDRSIRLDRLESSRRRPPGAGLQRGLKRAMEAHFFCCGIFTTWNLHVVIAASLELVIWEEPLIGPSVES
ncbi:MAG TPA: hypothetical protein VNX69_18845 [Steroidobacteraceae bacterium]|nr:hypothetical protein [Steroidobacteraceae bacterium]